VLYILGGIALAQAIPPIATYFFVAWSVCLSFVCRLSHSCTLLKLFDGFRCHLAGSNDTLCVRWGSETPGERETWEV